MPSLKTTPGQVSSTPASSASSGLSAVALARARALGQIGAEVSPAAPSAGVGAPVRSPYAKAGSAAAGGQTFAPQMKALFGAPKAAAPLVNKFAEHITGRILRVFFEDSQKGKAAMLIQGDDNERYRLEGAMTFQAEIGKRVSAQAVPEDTKWGVQYVAEVIHEEIPVDRKGATDYMVRVLDGVDKRIAGKLYETFGQSVFEVLQHDPRKFIGVGNIDEARLRTLRDSWVEDTAVRSIWTMLGRHGVSGAVSARIYSMFGAKALQIAKQQPYELTRVEGMGFLAADSIAQEAGQVTPESRARVAGALEFALESASENGHTALGLGALVEEVRKVTGLDAKSHAELIESVISERIEEGKLSTRVLNGRVCAQARSFANAERIIAEGLKSICDASEVKDSLVDAARDAAGPLGDEAQMAAVENVFKSGVSVITGRPGCGKTTILKTAAAVAKAGGLEVVMCAPTGKAGRRMTEATGFESGTMHSLLKPVQGSLSEFTHSAANPLEGDIFFVDEASMTDTLIAAKFVAAIPKGARLVIVGDKDQLESVQAGKVLQDIIDSGKVPVSRLMTPHRTALDSDIVVNAHRIINGDNQGIDLEGKKDFRIDVCAGNPAIMDAVLTKYRAMVRRFGVDKVQVLAAQHGTEVGVEELNKMLRNAVNPASPEKPEFSARDRLFRLGDRIMRTSNSKTLNVFNGEVGNITQVDIESKRVLVNFGDREIWHEKKELFALSPAFAMTVHKSQGSEYEGVITVVPNAHRNSTTRQLLYTSVTRGKKQSDIVCEIGALHGAVSRAASRRVTGLAVSIREAFGDAPEVAAQARADQPAQPARVAPVVSHTRAAQPAPRTPTPSTAGPMSAGVSAVAAARARALGGSAPAFNAPVPRPTGFLGGSTTPKPSPTPVRPPAPSPASPTLPARIDLAPKPVTLGRVAAAPTAASATPPAATPFAPRRLSVFRPA